MRGNLARVKSFKENVNGYLFPPWFISRFDINGLSLQYIYYSLLLLFAEAVVGNHLHMKMQIGQQLNRSSRSFFSDSCTLL